MTKIIIVGKGGSGKDYLRKKLQAKGFKYGISCTSRPPRPTEKDGVDYKFTSTEFFEKYPQYFYEVVKFNGWYYGTLNRDFKESDVFIMTPGGISKLKPEDREKALVIYLNPDKEVIAKRLSERNDLDDAIQRRMAADEEDFKDFKDYDIMITNPNF